MFVCVCAEASKPKIISSLFFIAFDDPYLLKGAKGNLISAPTHSISFNSFVGYIVSVSIGGQSVSLSLKIDGNIYTHLGWKKINIKYHPSSSSFVYRVSCIAASHRMLRWTNQFHFSPPHHTIYSLLMCLYVFSAEPLSGAALWVLCLWVVSPWPVGSCCYCCCCWSLSHSISHCRWIITSVTLCTIVGNLSSARELWSSLSE